jgi:hypothetical protein
LIFGLCVTVVLGLNGSGSVDGVFGGEGLDGSLFLFEPFLQTCVRIGHVSILDVVYYNLHLRALIEVATGIEVSTPAPELTSSGLEDCSAGGTIGPNG